MYQVGKIHALGGFQACKTKGVFMIDKNDSCARTPPSRRFAQRDLQAAYAEIERLKVKHVEQNLRSHRPHRRFDTTSQVAAQKFYLT